MKNKIKITPLSKLSLMILKVGMPLISVVFFYILYELLSASANEMGWEFVRAVSMLEYALMSFVIIFCGALLVDCAEKYDKR